MGDEPFPVEPPAAADASSMDVKAEPAAVEQALVGGDDYDDALFEEGSIAKEALKSEIADGLKGAKPDRAVVGEILLALADPSPPAELGIDGDER